MRFNSMRFRRVCNDGEYNIIIIYDYSSDRRRRTAAVTAVCSSSGARARTRPFYAARTEYLIRTLPRRTLQQQTYRYTIIL